MSNEASNTAVSHSAAKRTLALLTLVALLVTFSSVRVADAEDPSLDDVASTLDQAGLLTSSTSDPDADVAVDGSAASLPLAETMTADELLIDGVAATDEVVDTGTGTDNTGTDNIDAESNNAAPSDAAGTDSDSESNDLGTDDAVPAGTNAAEELTVSEAPDDTAAPEIEADGTYTEEDAIADANASNSDDATNVEADTYTEEDAVAASNEPPTAASLPVHGSFPVHSLNGNTATSDNVVVLEIEVGSSEDETESVPSSGYSSNGGVDTNDLLVGPDGRPVDGIPIHDVAHLSPAAVDESATSAAFGNLLVDTVSNTVSQAITQALPHRNWVPVSRPVAEIVVVSPEAVETPELQVGDEEDLLIFAAEQPGPPPAESDETTTLDAAAVDAPAEVPSTVVPTTAPKTTTPEITATTTPTPVTAAPTTAAPTTAAPTTLAPRTVASRPRPAAPTTVAPAPTPASPATPAVTTTAVQATTTTAPPVTVAPTTTTAAPTTVAVAPSAPDETAAPPTTAVVDKEEEVDFVVGRSGVAGNMVVEDDEEASADEQALEIPSPLGAFEFRGNAARLGAVWALWVLGTVAIMALWLPIPALRRNTNSSLPRRRS